MTNDMGERFLPSAARMPEQMPTLEIKELYKSFSGRCILQNVSVTAFPGEILGFLGPNGSGKTTTIKLMLGLLKPDAGSIRICGYDVAKEFEKAMAKVGGIVENPEMYKYLTGRQNLECCRRMYDDLPESRVDEVTALVRLEERIGDKVSKYSLGMRQRLGLAQAMLNSPRLLVLDEPTNGLDPVGIKELRDILKTVAHTEGVTVFISSHLLSELDQLCDRVAIIDRGRVLGSMTMDEIRHAGGEGNDCVSFTFLNPQKATEILRQLEIPYTVDPESGRITATMRKGTSPEAIRLLSEGGALVLSAIPVERSLEEVFLRLTTSFGRESGEK